MILLYIFSLLFLIGITYYVLNNEKNNDSVWYMYLKENQMVLFAGLIFIIGLIYLFDTQLQEVTCKDGYICYCIEK
jgi:TRAP-type mannitol/chloroaromatic compound transport system permease small subunit